MQAKNSLSLLVTAGGTQEDIDTVRSITNHATGRLGSLIADAFLENGAKVTYLCAETAVLPSSDCEVIKIRGVSQLSEMLEELLLRKRYDCVIHSMAVSDFTPCAVTTVDEMAEAVKRELAGVDSAESEISPLILNAILSVTGQPVSNKISSKDPYMLMVLKQTPKVIGRIKALQPDTLLVGFKLLSGVPESELVEAGLKLMAQNGCDYVLANDLRDIHGENHKAVLLDANGIACRADTKPEIAQMIVKTVTERLGK